MPEQTCPINFMVVLDERHVTIRSYHL